MNTSVELEIHNNYHPEWADAVDGCFYCEDFDYQLAEWAVTAE